jgi:hypothetical protein
MIFALGGIKWSGSNAHFFFWGGGVQICTDTFVTSSSKISKLRVINVRLGFESHQRLHQIPLYLEMFLKIVRKLYDKILCAVRDIALQWGVPRHRSFPQATT